MGPGEIPVHMLTHLYVSFGYINGAFQVTNMDGIDPSIYKNIGNVKARNPNLKIVIALGGWTFSDPGPWQAVFPTLASTKENRAIFIENLLGFLSEYGYDGVDFDWEYPGAEDRGGSEVDGENYTALLKELREAITASGREYIITFTAPSSYWYLRHFDIKAMETYADWINLMSYDLHGVWDRDNPIGNQVLAHTNLTEIDLALDLFWRVGIDPSSIVLGLGFYGRSFELESASCWKPGCNFKGPGEAGPCSNTPGILSYSEIRDILDKTGGESYFDEAAAARYMVYNGHSWISFDDTTTFKMKIDYANKMGLHGLMIWAIDLDTGNLEALKAISNGEVTNSTNAPFTLVDLERIFPADILPPKDVKTSYGIVNFGAAANSGQIDPNETGFGFILITGDSFAVSSLKKRNDEAEPLVFLDCPEDVRDQSVDQVQKARVACFSDNVEGCFRIMERGVEGTIVEMPDNCAPNSFARAISLEVSKDQTLPVGKRSASPTSEVFDFSFDLNLTRTRRDTDNTEIRIDYSNARGYWNAAVDSPGIQSGASASDKLAKRFFAEQNSDWRTMYSTTKNELLSSDDGDLIKEAVTAPLMWDTINECEVNGDDYEQGFGASISGNISAKFSFGFSLVASMHNLLDVKQANGFLNVKGFSNMTYSVGGIGEFDIKKAGKGNPAWTNSTPRNRGGHEITASRTGGAVSFQPYIKYDYMLASFNDTTESSASPSGPFFDGKLSAKVNSDFGGFDFNFPPNPSDKAGTRNVDREKTQIFIPEADNRVYNTAGKGGRIALSSLFTFGLKISLDFAKDMRFLNIPLTDMKVHYNTLTEFSFYPGLAGGAESCTDTEIITLAYQNYEIDDDDTLGWNESKALPYIVNDGQAPSEGALCYPQKPSLGRTAAWGYAPGNNIVDPKTYMDIDSAVDLESKQGNKFKCKNCLTCGLDKVAGACCGCVNMDVIYGYSDIEKCKGCSKDDGSWPGDLSRISKRDASDDDKLAELDKRENGKATMSTKDVSVCDQPQMYSVGAPYRYPAFPAPSQNDWERIEANKWDSISRYWGNTTLSCSDWSVGALRPHDTAFVQSPNGVVEVRAKYQTEHVFEGQIIGDFFTQWLDKGEINGQEPRPSNPAGKVPCYFTERYILRAQQSFPRRLNGKSAALIYHMLAELGNESHLDRLTILKARPNRMKGSMFSGNQPVATRKYAEMTPDEQLSATKEMGMVFTYLNEKDVWDAFCGTYEAIYDLLGDFDNWYTQNGAGFTIPSLQREWKEYINVVLSSLVIRSRASFDFQLSLATIRIPKFRMGGGVYGFHWFNNLFVNRLLIRIGRTCRNMDPISA